MKNQFFKYLIGVFLIFIILFSENMTVLENSRIKMNNKIPVPLKAPLFHKSSENFTFLYGVNQTNYFFNAKGASYIIAEVNGTDFTYFTIDNETYEINYGFNVFPKDFGSSFNSHNLSFTQADIDNQNIKWFAIEPLFIEEKDIIVNLTTYFETRFYAAGTIALLIQPDFPYNWLYLEVDGTIINNIYDPNAYPEIDSSIFSYFVEDGAYLSFTFHMEPKEHCIRMMGNGTLNYKIVVNYDWDEDLISDVDEVQKELFYSELDPTIPNIWGFFEKSTPLSYLNKTGSASGFFRFYIPELYGGQRYLYLNAKRGIISDIIVDDDDLTLKNIILSSNHQVTPYGHLTHGYHTVDYNYCLNEVTEILFTIDGRDIVVLDEVEFKDTDADGIKDIEERNNGLDTENSDTDQDGIPDNLDPSPLASMTLNRENRYQFIIPHDPTKNTKIYLKIKKPNPDFTALTSRQYLVNHSHGLPLNVTIYPILYVYGNHSTRGIYNIETYSLVDGYNYTGLGDPVPDMQNLNATTKYIFAKQTEEVLDFELSYPKGHPAKIDSVIDLRFRIIWLIIQNDSGTMKILHFYNFKEDILLQSMTIEETGDINYILGAPDSMIENQILWALAQNPQLGTPADYNVQDDIIGLGTVDYLKLANQTCEDRNNTQLKANETEVLYVAGLQSSLDILNKINLKTLENPSFQINHSGENLVYYSFYAINDLEATGSDPSNYEELFGENKVCYIIGWNNFSTSTSVNYNQTVKITAFPISMDSIIIQNSKILKITHAMGSQIPLSMIPSSIESALHDRIVFLNQTFIEPIESGLSFPSLMFNTTKHILKEKIDNRQGDLEASRLIFNSDYLSESEVFANFYAILKNVSYELKENLLRIPELNNYLSMDLEEIWQGAIPSQRIVEIHTLKTFCSSLSSVILSDIISAGLDIKGLKSHFDDFKRNRDKLMNAIKPLESEIDLIKNYASSILHYSRFTKFIKIAKNLNFIFKGITQLCTGFITAYQLISQMEDLLENDTLGFVLNMSKAIGGIVAGTLSIAGGIIKLALQTTKHMLSNTLRLASKVISKVALVVAIIIGVIDIGYRIWNAYIEAGEDINAAVNEAELIMLETALPFIPIIQTIMDMGPISLVFVFPWLSWWFISDYLKSLDTVSYTNPANSNVSVELVWSDADGDPLTYINFKDLFHIEGWGGTEVNDGIEFQLTFYNNGSATVGIENMVAIPYANGSLTFDYHFFSTEWLAPDEYYTTYPPYYTFIEEPSPNLTILWNLVMRYQNLTVIYNETMEIKCNRAVCPKEIAGFYVLTHEFPSKNIENTTEITIAEHPLIEIDPLIGWGPVNLSLETKGYNDTVVNCNISINNTDFSIDPSNFTQNLFSSIEFNITSLNFNKLGGIHHFKLDVRINDTSELILSQNIPFRLCFLRNLTYTQSNVLHKEEINKIFYAWNLSTPIFPPIITVRVGNILFMKYKTNSTKKIDLTFYNNSQLIKTYLIRSRGYQNLTTQFIQVLIDESFTFNKIFFNSSLVNSDYLKIESITIINATGETPQNQLFNPMNFSNNGNVPEYVKLSFSGVPFDNIDTSLYPDEFIMEYQMICVMPGENRTCLFNISEPTIAISNILSRSITVFDPIKDNIAFRYIDFFAIDGIYINNPENKTHIIYNRENNASILFSIISQEELTWSAYSLDAQTLVDFSQSVYIPIPEDGIHKIQVFGKNALNESFESDERYFTINSILINLTLPEDQLYLDPLVGNIFNATYGFENDPNGTNPSGWQVSNNVYVQNCVDGHLKVVELYQESESMKYTETFPRSYGTIEFWIRFEDVENRIYVFDCKDSITDNYLLLVGAWSNTWYYYKDLSTILPIPNVSTPQNNKWYHIRIDFRCNNASPYLALTEDRFIITIDGISSGELTHYYQGMNDYGSFTIRTGSSNYDARLWVDAVGFSWDPEYEIGANYNNESLIALSLAYETPVYLDKIYYCLDGQDLRALLIPDLITFAENGTHTLQVFGTDMYEDLYESRITIFAASWVDITTPAGNNIFISDPNTGIELNFTNIITNGTTIIQLKENTSLPSHPSTLLISGATYNLLMVSAFYYEISTTSTFSDEIIVKIPYNEDKVQLIENNLRLFQYNGFWENVTQEIDSENNLISGEITSLSRLVVLEIFDDKEPHTNVYLNGSDPTEWNEFDSNVLVSFIINEAVSGVNETLYSFDGSDWMVYTGPFTLCAEGYYPLHVYSTDKAGNIEGWAKYNIIIDKAAPFTEIEVYPSSVDANGIIHVPWGAEFNFVVDDFSATNTYYRINDGSFILYDDNPFQFPETGMVIIYFYSEDAFGHTEFMKNVTLYKESAQEFFTNMILNFLILPLTIIGGVILGILITRRIFKRRRNSKPSKKTIATKK